MDAMKKLCALLLAVLLFCTGCFNTTEEIAIQPNGSGVYGVTLDFSGIFDLLQSMGGESSEAMKELKQNRDTIIHFSSFTDTAKDLSKEEKALLRDATMRMIMQDSTKKFLMELKYPFKKLTDVERIMALARSNGNVLGKALGAKDAGPQPEMPNLNSYYDLTFRNGLIEKKVNAEKLKEFQSNPQYEQMKQASALLGDAMISSIIRLPKSAKKVEGANAKQSDGGKTITISASMADVLENPNALTFHIEY